MGIPAGLSCLFVASLVPRTMLRKDPGSVEKRLGGGSWEGEALKEEAGRKKLKGEIWEEAGIWKLGRRKLGEGS